MFPFGLFEYFVVTNPLPRIAVVAAVGLAEAGRPTTRLACETKAHRVRDHSKTNVEHYIGSIWHPDMLNDPYREILTALARALVDFIIGGGVACVLQGVERVTMDVDLAVSMLPTNLPSFLQVMKELGLRPRVPVDPASLLNPAVVKAMVEEKHALVFSFLDPDAPIRHVDIFLRSDLSYEVLLPESEWVKLGDISVRILTRKKLLSIKLGIQPPRAKDLLDIEFLRRHVT